MALRAKANKWDVTILIDPVMSPVIVDVAKDTVAEEIELVVESTGHEQIKRTLSDDSEKFIIFEDQFEDTHCVRKDIIRSIKMERK